MRLLSASCTRLPACDANSNLLQCRQAGLTPMSYSRRIQIAVILSVLLHVAGVVALHFVPDSPPSPMALVDPAPIEIDLQPEAPSPREPVQLVDVATPSAAPVPPSPLIAEDNAEAMEEAPKDGDLPSPELTPDEFDQLAAVATPATKPKPISAPPVEQEGTQRRIRRMSLSLSLSLRTWRLPWRRYWHRKKKSLVPNLPKTNPSRSPRQVQPFRSVRRREEAGFKTVPPSRVSQTFKPFKVKSHPI